MDKRLTNSAMLFSVGFVFMLVCAVAAFFYGVQIGTDKMEAKYEANLTSEASKLVPDSPYQQQDLVSFYHTVFTPFREFQNEWSITISKIGQGQMADAKSGFNALAKLADQKAEAAKSYDLQASPLISDAQISYIRSLMLFKDAATAAADLSKTYGGGELLSKIGEDKNYKAAVQETLSAQNAYYSAMQKWAASIDPDIPDENAAGLAPKLAEWSKLPLTVKNSLLTQYLAKRGEMNIFYPQDLTARIDDFIVAGKAAQMKLTTVFEVSDLLIDTDAVRNGDFNMNKDRFYKSELLPQLPFFFPEMN
ncbi:hypothetical protein [Paenibacillus sp. HB172176]|uniref:hypothetical protein n=1 Tax=Paenibacillus sp. HB172176 TaxID=2493690 RepID=UPI00143A8FD2|nr:hypothetical protein [Paenibacillus sp. HB172176]